MSVQSAVARAMRRDRVVTPNEYESIYSELLPSVRLANMHDGDYLISQADRETLGSAHFRNEDEQ